MANSIKENDPKIMTLVARGYIMTKRREEGAKIIEKVKRLSKGKSMTIFVRYLLMFILKPGSTRKRSPKSISCCRRNAPTPFF